ncbi:MAG: hypothetical protein NUV80_01060 [Candidatus Berkelbacteria bacterium]|nr:hypothetical protein [Candidatus Berkelbacteria bacterium]
MQVLQKIKQEISSYLTESVQVGEGNNYSQYKTVNKISLYRNRTYPYGKVDSQGYYKYWFDIIQPKVDNEVKNVDLDRANVFLHSDSSADAVPVFILNAKLKQWMRDEGMGEKINEAEETGAAEGNVVWKRTANGYEKLDLRNLFVIITTAETLNDTPVVERHNMTQSELRKMKGTWQDEAVDKVIKNCGSKMFSAVSNTQIKQATETPYYEVFERNGEVSTKELQEAQGVEGGDDNTFVLAKVICAGIGDSQGGEYILFAEEIDEMPYVEYHRGPYKGTWLREGLVWLLLDVQTRFNKVKNEMAKLSEWAAKIIFRSNDLKTVQNALTDLMNGDILKSADIQQVPVVSQGFVALANELVELIDLANRISNSFEITSGEALPSGTPLGLGKLYDQNANKFYGYLQEKFGLAYAKIIKDWMLPQLVKDIKSKDIVTITGDDKYLNQYYQMAVDSWYVRNLIAIGPHTAEQAQALKEAKLQELLKAKKEARIELEQGVFTGVLKRIQVVITNENFNVSDTQSLIELVKLETDPVRRSALVEVVAQRTIKGVDFASLPKTPPAPPQPMQPVQQTMQPASATAQ